MISLHTSIFNYNSIVNSTIQKILQAHYRKYGKFRSQSKGKCLHIVSNTLPDTLDFH